MFLVDTPGPGAGELSSERLRFARPAEGIPEHSLDQWKPFGLSATMLAKALGVTPARINEIVRGRRGITAETALRLARYFGTDARSWMNLQDRYELEIAARDKAEALRAIRPHDVAARWSRAPATRQV